jgi:hypothetical protein
MPHIGKLATIGKLLILDIYIGIRGEMNFFEIPTDGTLKSIIQLLNELSIP